MRFILGLILFPLMTFAGIVHTPLNLVVRYPSNTTSAALSPNVIPGATTTNDFVARLTTDHRTAMFGTVDAFCQHAIFPAMRRYGSNWSTPTAEECSFDTIDLVSQPGWVPPLRGWQYAPAESRDFSSHGERFSGIYQFMTGQVYNAYSVIDWTKWGASATPGQLLHWNSSGWTTNFFDIVSDQVVQRYMMTLPELGGTGIVENAFFRPWQCSAPIEFIPYYFQGCSEIIDPINEHVDKNLSLRGNWQTPIRLSDVLSQVAGNRFTGIRFRPSERLWWWSFAYPNSVLAAANLSLDELSSDGGPRLVTKVQTVNGGEASSLYAENLTATISILDGTITGFTETDSPHWREIVSGSVSGTNAVATPYPSAGVSLHCSRSMSLYGSFFEIIPEGVLLELANRLIPEGDNSYHQVQAAYEKHVGTVGIIIYSFRDLAGTYITQKPLTYSDKPCTIDAVMVDADLSGRVWSCGAVIPFLEGCPQSANWPLEKSWRTTKPHPVCQSLVGAIHLTQLLSMMTSTNASDVADFSAIDFNSGWKEIPNSGIAEFSCANKVVSKSADIDNSASELFHSLINTVYARAASYSGLNLAQTASFSGATATIAAREYFHEQINHLPEGISVSLEALPALIIKRIGPGNTIADFELETKDGVGPIRDVNDGLHFTFTFNRYKSGLFRPASSEATIDRNLTITQWLFPAMQFKGGD